MLVDKDVYLAYEIVNFLEHHGVKGQKWGIRHPRLKTLEFWNNNTLAKKAKALSDFNEMQIKKHGGSFHLTDKEKVAGLGAAFVGLAALGIATGHGKQFLSGSKTVVEDLEKERASLKPGDHISRALSKKMFDEAVVNRMGNDKGMIYGMEHAPGFTIPNSSSLKRMSFDVEKGMGDRPITWATYGTADQNRYKSLFGSSELGISKEISIKLNSDLKIAGTDDVVQTMRETLGKDGNLASTEEALQSLNHAVGGVGPSAQPFINNLKDKGFGGMIDYVDAGMIGEKPLVIFNTNAIGTYTSHDITPEEWKEASDNLVLMKNLRWMS